MNKTKNITVRVTPELYRQTRHLAARYDTTVTELVEYLLERMPRALDRARFPVGGCKTPVDGATATPPPTACSETEKSRCTVAQPPTSSPSMASTCTAARCTAAVPLYKPRNQQNQKHLTANITACTAVVHWLFKCLSNLSTTRQIKT